MKKLKFLNTIYFVFLISLLFSFVKQLIATYDYGSWGISEFLINYQAGFVRRGLLGEILFFLTKQFNIDVIFSIKIISLISFILVCTFFIISFLRKGYSLYLLPLCFFCGGAISLMVDGFWIRKDFLMLCFYIMIMWVYNKNTISKIKKIIYINILLIFILLIHEVFAFFSLPVLFVMFANSYKYKGRGFSIVLSIMTLFPAIISFLLISLVHGTPDIAQTIWNSWQIITNQTPTVVSSGNAIGAIGWSILSAIKFHFKSNFIEHGIYPVIFWGVILPSIYYTSTTAITVFKKRQEIYTERDRTVLSLIIFFQFLCLLPLYTILSVDSFRIVFYMISSSFVLFLIVPMCELSELFPNKMIKIVSSVNHRIDTLLPPSKNMLIVFFVLWICMGTYFQYKIQIYNLLHCILS